MRAITPQLPAELERHVGTLDVSRANAYPVKSYRELMQQVARLAYLNKDHLLFFRGQQRDYRNKAGASTIYPAIYRGERVSQQQIELRFAVLTSAAKRLCAALAAEDVTGHADVRRRRYIQWSILQHYEVCPTPLLDLTHSLRVASSFASLDGNGDPYVFVLGLPFITNRVSTNSEHDLVTVRLLSICPPEGLRPYYQDGYLTGTEEVTSEYDSKDELDFNRRLIAKFRLRRRDSFWSAGFAALPKDTLYPGKDRLQEICEQVAGELGTEVDPGRIGKFLQEWTDLESRLMTLARERRQKVYSLREALSVLREAELLPRAMLGEVDDLRKVRNKVVHRPGSVGPEDLVETSEKLSALVRQVKSSSR